ncbi:hypothetical protein ACQKWADRAFT_301658, partial [Trichoderma austrokoningii]
LRENEVMGLILIYRCFLWNVYSCPAIYACYKKMNLNISLLLLSLYYIWFFIISLSRQSIMSEGHRKHVGYIAIESMHN